jgi:hypothetical protein
MTTTVIEQLPEVVNIAMRRGDSFGLAVQVWDDDAQTVPTDLTGATIAAQSREDPDGTLIGDWEVTVTGNTIGLVLAGKVAAGLPELSYWDCQVDWFADGITVTTLVAGAIAADRDVTWL